MPQRLIARTTLAIAVAAAFAGSAHAGLPVDVKNEHPRLYATQADLERLKAEVPIGPEAFPLKSGRISFELTPSAKGANDASDANIFGNQKATTDSIYIRYTEKSDVPTGYVALQFALRRGDGTNIAVLSNVQLPVGVKATIELAYDGAAHKATARVNNVDKPLFWFADNNVPRDWPGTARQPFMLQPHKADQLGAFRVEALVNGAYTTVWERDTIDLAAAEAWRDVLVTADKLVTEFGACNTDADPATQSGKCNTTADGRVNITEPAKQLALAYRVTRDPRYLGAARRHMALIAKAQLIAGGEWSMSGRVGAMGLYFDWMHDALTDAELNALAQGIKDTIAADKLKVGADDNPNDDLIYSICGVQALTNDATTFDCRTKPVYEEWKRDGSPSIAASYISGHTASATTGAALGLLAIVNDGHGEVRPMLDTIYDHFDKGFLKAREIFAVDGGNHTAFAYGGSGGGDTADRLVMWKRALKQHDPEAGLQSPWLPKLIYPYIYGLRHDDSFPARGDDYFYSVTNQNVGSMALASVASGGDPYALTFYRDYVQANRYYSGGATSIWERLLFPHAITPAPLTDLPLSRYFRVAGNVLMRDTWTYPEATLLEFKSTSFISENHQHLDQNSYSLNYKGPLLIDSGMYDSYGSLHWSNYTQRTIAHNTVTVLDPKEKFGDTVANDGGQWYGDRPTYPTIEEIAPGARNALDGVTAFEEGVTYSYVQGNASKAYVYGKLDPNAGFVRDIVYLRPAGTRPTVLVFDSVRPTKPGLTIASVLHTVNQPVTTIAPNYLGDGRSRLDYTGGVIGPITVRNNGGMVTVQTLLPSYGYVALVGGKDIPNRNCTQAANPKTGTNETSGGDCRFVVRLQKDDGSEVWRNFAPVPGKEQVRGTDIGAWRVEFTPYNKTAIGATENFLNVLHVANDDQRSGVASINAATLLSRNASATAVRLADGKVVVFNGAATPGATLTWTRPVAQADAPTLVVGFQKDKRYTITKTVSGATETVTLQAVDGSGEPRSSEGGVVRLGWN